jgi:hypothetical protein
MLEYAHENSKRDILLLNEVEALVTNQLELRFTSIQLNLKKDCRYKDDLYYGFSKSNHDKFVRSASFNHFPDHVTARHHRRIT